MKQWAGSWINEVSWRIGAGASLISYWLFKDLKYIKPLLFFMVCDILIGLLSAVNGASKKTKNGCLSSTQMFLGVVKKICTLIMVSVAVQLDNVLELNYIANTACIAFICQELLSITENYGRILPLPAIFKKAIEIFENKEEDISK